MDRFDYRYNLETRKRVRGRMLNLARQLVAGEVGVIVAARELNTFHDVVEPEIRAILDTFVGIDSETDALPLADEVRQLWDSGALKAKDALIAGRAPLA